MFLGSECGSVPEGGRPGLGVEVEVQKSHSGNVLMVPVKSEGRKGEGLFWVTVDVGFQGARKALQSLVAAGLPRGAGPAELLPAPESVGARQGSELEPLRFPAGL